MKNIVLKSIFLFTGLMMSLIYNFSFTTSIYFIISLILTCIIEISSSNKLSSAVKLAFLIGCIFSYNLSFYLPLLVYDSYQDNKKYWLLISCVPIYHFTENNNNLLILVSTWSLISGYLKHDYLEFQKISILYQNQRDSMIENTLLLEEKNQSLIREKEYEIQIATLDERNRIARDIHDNIGHILSSSLLQVGAIKTINTQKNLNDSLVQLQNTLETGMDNIRKSVHNLYDTSIDFKVEIEKIIDNFKVCPINFTYTISSTLDSRIISQILSILNEGLYNIEKHSNATKVELTLREQTSFYQIILLNNGVTKPIQESGIGLKNTKTRVHNMNGNINISCEDNTFRIFITLPKEEA